MTKAADIIAVLRAARPAPVVERHTGMPYGWGLWLRALKERLGAIQREGADAWVAHLVERPVAAVPQRPQALNRWQSFRSMFYQDWGPPLREDRRLRWFAGGLSLLMHLLFVMLLVLLAMIKLPPPPVAEEESRVQVEFMGEGTPEDAGGGPPAPESAAAPSAAQPASRASTAAPTPEAAQASAVPQEEAPVPAPPAAQQNVQVTEVQVPTRVFVLPPATVRVPEVTPPQVTVRELGVPTREVTVVQAPPAQRELPQREIAVPQLSQPTQEVRQREIASPLPQIRTVQVPTRDIAAPQLRAPAQTVRQAEIAAPNRGAASSTSNAPASRDAASGDAARAASATQGTQPSATASGSAAAANRPGAVRTPTRGDDWGDSTRNAPGQQTGGTRAGDGPGLFNADGSVKVPGNATGDASRPGAPGSKQQQRADADRASKWLERPEFPYEPTMFDKYWRPTNESMLAEWVRRSIREVEMKIPGTNKRVRCVVSVLQAGGACGLYDPNLNDQPASARPPPDIPVKRNPIPTDS